MNLSTRSISILGAMGAAVLSLSACAPGGTASLGGPMPLTPTARYSLQAEPGLDRIALAVHEAGLSSNQQAALGELVNRFAREGAGQLVVEAPSGGDATAAALAWSIRTTLVASGVPQERIQVVSYLAPNPKAPVLAGFETMRAVVPQCGRAWGSLTRTGDNQPASNFGCAVTANLAAQTTQPRDLNGPRALSPAYAARRTVVFENYGAGTATSAAPEPLMSKAEVKQAVQ
jgi:pilus assembly protein CpaD